MMKSISFLIGLLSICLSSLAQNSQLTILFEGVEGNQGNVFIRIHDDKGKTITSQIIPAKGDQTIFNIDLPPGQYAVSAFHDINKNQELDKNLVGAPTEPYGFSNNARGTFGRPDLEEQLIMLDRNEKISIQLK